MNQSIHFFQVHQEMVTCTLQQELPLLVALLLRKQAERPHDHKIIVFFAAAKVTAYAAEFWTGQLPSQLFSYFS